ncbi:hypothetical protein Tco_0382728 [Tanacetum coccineum]
MHVSLVTDGHLMSWYMVPLRKAHIKPTSLLSMISSSIFEKIEKVKSLASVIKKKLRRDRGTRRGRQSTSSSTFDQPSSSHLNNDDDGNNEWASRASTPSPIYYVNSLTNQVPQVFQNPPNIDPQLEPFYTRQTEIINRQVQLRDEQRGGVSKAYINLNKHTRKVKESLNVTFHETPPPSNTSPLVDDDLDKEKAIKVTEKKNLENNIVDETLEIDEIVNIKESRNHPLENVIGNLNQRTLRSQAQNESNFFCFISTIEPKNVNEALGDASWIVAMQEELNQFIANECWVLRNKLDENGVVSQNNARLVAQGYNQQEGIDYDET